MEEQEISPELLEEMEDLQGEDLEEQQLDQGEVTEDFGAQTGYGYPEPEEKMNQHAFISKAVDMQDLEKVTYLKQEELGRPLFNVRFLLDMEDISKHYLDPLLLKYKITLGNRISNYFRHKINNICSSGLSNEGFIHTMNITKKMEATRTRMRGNVENLNMGKKKRPR